MAFRYKNRSTGTQTINLNSGRSVYVASGEEITLEKDEESSDEILGKIRGSHPTGAIRNDKPATTGHSKTPSSPPLKKEEGK